MKQNSLTKRFRMTVYTLMLGLWVFTTLNSLSTDLSDSISRYETSEGFLRAIQVVISLPTLFIYLATAFAAVTFAVYSHKISGSKEGSGYENLASGLMLTVLSFALSGLLGVLAVSYSNTPRETTFIIVQNYLSLAVAIAIYTFFYRGSKQLINTLKMTKKQTMSLLTKQRVIQLFVLLVSACYTFLVFQNPYRTVSDNPDINPVFGLPDWLIFTTIVVPYVFTWMLGATATVNLSYYARNVNGVIYKNIFGKLAQGFAIIVGFTIVFQIIGQFSDYWAQSGLGTILALLGVIFIGMVVAYLQFGLAAQKLDKIETV